MLAGLKSAFGFGNEQKANALNEQQELVLLNIRSTASNIHVGPGNAMEVPAVNCAVSIISEKAGDTPFKLYKSDTRETAREHPAYKLIHDEADAFTSAAQFRINLSADAMLHGNGHAHVIRSSDDRPIALQRLEPGTVQNRTEDDGTPFYVVSEGRGQRRYEFTDILHIQPFGGKAPIKTAREAIALAIAFERHMAGLLANGGRPSGIILAKKRLDPDPKQKIADSWFSTHGGKNAGGTAILDEEMTYQQIATTLADAQFAENRLEQIREIGRAFRIPPTMLFELTRGTWSNTEEMARQFYTVTLKPWLTAWTWAYSRVLLTPEERHKFYIEPVLDDLLTTDFAKKATAFGQYRSMGVYTANEVRRMLNMPPHPDGDSLSNPHITTTPNTAPEDPEAPKEAA